MSLHIQHLQVAVGDPPDRRPSGYGYWVAAGDGRYSTWPFSTAAQRAHYEEAVSRYLDLEGLLRPAGAALQIAALVAVSMEGDTEDDLATRFLVSLGITGRLLDDLRTIATHALTKF